MKFLNQTAQTNWKLFAIVTIVAIILVGGGILLFKVAQAPPMEMRTVALCDLNTDGQCDATDHVIFQQALGKKVGEVGYRLSADVNADGVVTARDQQVLFPVTSPVLQPQTVDTSTWQTYRSDEFGFEVRYPREWTALEHSSRSVEFHHPNNNPYISLVVFENIRGSGDESVRGITFCEAYPNQCTREKLSIGGVQTTIEWRLHDASVNFGIPNKNYVMSISFNSNFEKTSSEEMKLFLQILSTFRFTER